MRPRRKVGTRPRRLGGSGSTWASSRCRGTPEDRTAILRGAQRVRSVIVRFIACCRPLTYLGGPLGDTSDTEGHAMKRRTLAAVVTALMLTVGGMGAAQGTDGGEQIAK